jgi:hypothetical protein
VEQEVLLELEMQELREMEEIVVMVVVVVDLATPRRGVAAEPLVEIREVQEILVFQQQAHKEMVVLVDLAPLQGVMVVLHQVYSSHQDHFFLDQAAAVEEVVDLVLQEIVVLPEIQI